MKFLKLISCAILLFYSCIGYGQQRTTFHDISVFVPEGWTIEEHGGYVRLVFEEDYNLMFCSIYYLPYFDGFTGMSIDALFSTEKEQAQIAIDAVLDAHEKYLSGDFFRFGTSDCEVACQNALCETYSTLPNKGGVSISGRVYTFAYKNNRYTIDVLSNIPETENILRDIVASVRLNDLDCKNEYEIAWKLFNINDIAIISLPSSLEKYGVDGFARATGVDIVFAPTEKFSAYSHASVCIAIEDIEEGADEYYVYVATKDLHYREDFDKFNSHKLVKIMDKEIKKGLTRKLFRPLSGKLIKWNPVEFGRNQKGDSYYLISFVYKLDKAVIQRDMYVFYSDKKQVTLTFSFDVTKRKIWGSDFEKIAHSFEFTGF